MSSSPDAEPTFEFLPEVATEAAALPEAVRREIARIVVELHRDPHLGEPMDDRPPRILQGCRKVRFDEPGHRGKPRYRLVYRNEPTDGAPGRMVVLAIAERRNMIAYSKAAARQTRRAGAQQVRRS